VRLCWDLTEWQIQKRVDGGFWKRQDDAEEMTSEGFKKKDGPGARWEVACCFSPFHSDPAKSRQPAKGFRLMIGWSAGSVGQYMPPFPNKPTSLVLDSGGNAPD